METKKIFWKRWIAILLVICITISGSPLTAVQVQAEGEEGSSETALTNQERLDQYIRAAIEPTNTSLIDTEDNQQIMTVDVAEGTYHIDICMYKEEYQALKLLGVPFLTELFQCEEIKEIQIGKAIEETDSQTGETSIINRYVLNRDPNASTTNSDQFNLMLLTSFAVLGKQFDYDLDKYTEYLMGEMSTLTISAMDGGQVDEIILFCESPTGEEYTTTYTAEFYNLEHDLTVNYIDQNGDAIDESLITQHKETLKYGDRYEVLIPETIGENYKRQTGEKSEVSGNMGKADIIENIKYSDLRAQAKVYYTVEDPVHGNQVQTKSFVVGQSFVDFEPDIPMGYSFSGWTWTNADGEVLAERPTNMTVTDLYATGQIRVNKHTLTIDNNGSVTEEDLAYGTKIDLPDPIVPEGHEFKNWIWTDENGNTIDVQNTMPDYPVTVTSQVIPKEYTICFESEYGVQLEKKTYQYGQTIIPWALPDKESDKENTYSFVGWKRKSDGEIITDFSNETVNCDDTYVATYNATPIEYSVIFKSEGTIVNEKTGYKYGETIIVPADPNKSNYTFKGWKKSGEEGERLYQANEIPQVTEAVEYTAVFEPIMHKICFLDWDNSVISEQEYLQGSEITVPTDPTRTADKTYAYEFKGWDKTVSGTADAAATYKAEYTESYILYKITFVDPEGGIISEKADYHYGDQVQMPQQDAKYLYTTDSWDRTYSATVTGNVTYSAKSDCNLREYTVTFQYYGGSDTGKYYYGETISIPEDPKSYEEGSNTYTFSSWEPMIAEDAVAVADVTYVAQYTDGVSTFTVEFMNEDGTVSLGKQTISYGESAYYGSEPEKEPTKEKVYQFSGWKNVVNGLKDADLTNITSNMKVYASFEESVRKYIVTFENPNGEILEEQGYRYNEEITSPDEPVMVDKANRYEFAYLWKNKATGELIEPNDLDMMRVQEDGLVFVAQYDATPYEYTVKFVSPDGKVLVEESGCYYGREVIPMMPLMDERYIYTQNSWDQPLIPVEGDVTYTARADCQKRTYDVVFQYNDGEIVKTDPVIYEGNASAPEDMSKLPTAEFIYTFKGWTTDGGVTILSAEDVNQVIVTEPVTYTAVYELEKQKYTISWYIPNLNKTIKEIKEYGETLTPPTEDEVNPQGAVKDKYHITGWDKSITTVEKDITYTASTERYPGYVARINDQYFASIEEALASAQSGDAVMVDQDTRIEADATIPKGVTLLLPCQDDDEVFVPSMTSYGPDGVGAGSEETLYRRVTIAEDATLTVEGTLIVNAVTGRQLNGASKPGKEQNVSGGYAQVDLEGKIVVEDGGLMDVSGYVRGDGMVEAKKGSTVYDLFVVMGWRGGSQAAKMYFNSIYPMNESNCHNIESTIRIYEGASYEGTVKMYADGSQAGASGLMYCYTRFPQVNTTNGLIRLTNGGYVEKRYEDGYEIYDIYGDVNFSKSTLVLIGLEASTNWFVYPIDGDIKINVHQGTITFREPYKFMPGSELNLGKDTKMVVESNKTVVFYEDFEDPMTVNPYPSGRPAAILNMAEGASLQIKGDFGGIIQSAGKNIITKADKTNLNPMTYEAHPNRTIREVYTDFCILSATLDGSWDGNEWVVQCKENEHIMPEQWQNNGTIGELYRDCERCGYTETKECTHSMPEQWIYSGTASDLYRDCELCGYREIKNCTHIMPERWTYSGRASVLYRDCEVCGHSETKECTHTMPQQWTNNITQGEQYRNCCICNYEETRSNPVDWLIQEIALLNQSTDKETKAESLDRYADTLSGAQLNQISNMDILTGEISKIYTKKAASMEKPTNIKSKESETSVSLSWDVVATANGYVVVLKDSSGSAIQTIRTSETWTEFTNLRGGTAYQIEVIPYITNDNKEYQGCSVAIEVRTDVGAASELKATPSYTSVKLRWKAPASGADGYRVRVYSSKGKLLNTYNKKKVSLSVKGLSEGTTYRFVVLPYIEVDGQKVYSPKTTTVVAKTKVETPSKTKIKNLKTGKKYIKVTWKKVECDGYEIMIAQNSNFTKDKTIYKVKGSATSKKITKLKKGRKYYIKVRAYKKVGNKTYYGKWCSYKSKKCQ